MEPGRARPEHQALEGSADWAGLSASCRQLLGAEAAARGHAVGNTPAAPNRPAVPGSAGSGACAGSRPASPGPCCPQEEDSDHWDSHRARRPRGKLRLHTPSSGTATGPGGHGKAASAHPLLLPGAGLRDMSLCPALPSPCQAPREAPLRGQRLPRVPSWGSQGQRRVPVLTHLEQRGLGSRPAPVTGGRPAEPEGAGWPALRGPRPLPHLTWLRPLCQPHPLSLGIASWRHAGKGELLSGSRCGPEGRTPEVGKAQEGWGARGKPRGGARVGPGGPGRALFVLARRPRGAAASGWGAGFFLSGHPVTREGQRGQRMARAAWHRLCNTRGEAGTPAGEASCSWPLAPQLHGVLGHLQAGSTQAPAG